MRGSPLMVMSLGVLAGVAWSRRARRRRPSPQPAERAPAQAWRLEPGQALARQTAAIRYLPPSEQYKPGDPLRFIHDARVREHKSLWPDSTPDGFDTGQIDPSRLRGLQKDNLYLDLKDSEAARRGNT